MHVDLDDGAFRGETGKDVVRKRSQIVNSKTSGARQAPRGAAPDRKTALFER